LVSRVHNSAVPPLAEGELIDDRSLEELDADRFHHGDFVEELSGLAQQVKTPANIALFGAWGSGKSGIANLLAEALPDDEKQVRMVVFDASKYAEAPLRRHFISQVAHRLRIKNAKYHEGLYQGTESRNVKFRPGEWGKLAWWFVTSVALAVAVLLLVATIAAAVSTGAFENAWSSIVPNYLLAALPVGALITTFVKLAADGFHIKTTRTAPSGDEEFEKRFDELVDDANTKRLIVFVDELDRCSPAQVASTLETMKTFLFVKRCVFVVAADQQVIEQALRLKVRQHTPEDAANPYYSAGSAYLDKVFQYQLTLPPLKPAALSRFALKLVKDQAGVWSRVENLDEVIPVLIPTHVVSPRRVKVLLNRFALAYRLAERRVVEGHLQSSLPERATELAKLVCLQCEFPLFAEDLSLDARLPKLVRLVADKEEMPPAVPAHIADTARAYAEGRRSVAELLVDARPEADWDARPRDQDEDHEPVEDGDNNAARADEPGDEDSRDTSRATAVAREHAQQLVAYLRKTQHVTGPARDLLYLESAGAERHVDAELADQLERASIDNDRDEVLRLVTTAPDDDQARDALLVLADVVRQEQPGPEGRNVVSVLLQAITRSGVDLDGAADPIADAVASHLEQASLGADDLRGALTLAGASSRSVAPKLLKAVLMDPELPKNHDVASAAIARTPDTPPDLRERLAGAAAAALVHEPAQAGRELAQLDDEVAARLVEEATGLVASAGSGHYKAIAAAESEQPEVDGAIKDPSPDRALASVFDQLPEGHSQSMVAVLVLLLRIDHQDARNAAAQRLAKVEPITDPRLISSVLSATHKRAASDYAEWLDRVDPAALAEDEGSEEWADSLRCEVWGMLDRDEPPSPEAFDTALQALGRCASDSTLENDFRRQIAPQLSAATTTDDELVAHRSRLARARKFVDAGLLDPSALADMDVDGVIATLGAAVPQPGMGEQVSPAIVERVRVSAEGASEEKLTGVLDAVGTAAWLPSAASAALRLRAVTGLRRFYPDTDDPVPFGEVGEVGGLAAQDAVADEATANWLDVFAAHPEDAWQVVEPLAGAELPTRTQAAVARYTASLDAENHFTFVDCILRRSTTNTVHASMLEAAHLSEVDAKTFADRVVELFADVDSIEMSRRAMHLWHQFNPTSQAARRKLVEALYLPLIRQEDEGLDIALSQFGLVAPVKDVRGKVRDALRSAAQTDDQKQRVDQRLFEAGWTRKSLFGFGPARDED